MRVLTPEACEINRDLILTAENEYRPGGNAWSLIRIRRHCDKNGNLIHIQKRFQFDYCSFACSVEQELSYRYEDVLRIKFPRGVPIRLPEYAVPILAGHKQDGDRPFLARAHWLALSPYSYNHYSVSKGTKVEELRFPDGWKMFAPTSIVLHDLRYAADKYPRRSGPDEFMAGDDNAGLDAAGPYSWKFVRYVSKVEDVPESDSDSMSSYDASSEGSSITGSDEVSFDDDSTHQGASDSDDSDQDDLAPPTRTRWTRALSQLWNTK